MRGPPEDMPVLGHRSSWKALAFGVLQCAAA